MLCPSACCGKPGPWDWVHSPAVIDCAQDGFGQFVLFRDGPYVVGLGRTVIPEQNDPGWEEYSVANDPVPFDIDVRAGDGESDAQYATNILSTLAPHATTERWYYMAGAPFYNQDAGVASLEVGCIDVPWAHDLNSDPEVQMGGNLLESPNEFWNVFKWDQGDDAVWDDVNRELKSTASYTGGAESDIWVSQTGVVIPKIPTSGDGTGSPTLMRLTISAKPDTLTKLYVEVTVDPTDPGPTSTLVSLIDLSTRTYEELLGFSAQGSMYSSGTRTRPGEGDAWVYDLYFGAPIGGCTVGVKLRLGVDHLDHGAGYAPVWVNTVNIGDGAYIRSAHLCVANRYYSLLEGDPAGGTIGLAGSLVLFQAAPLSQSVIHINPSFTDDLAASVDWADTFLFDGYYPGTELCTGGDPCVPGLGVRKPPLDVQSFYGYFGLTPYWPLPGVASVSAWTPRWLRGPNAVPIIMPWNALSIAESTAPYIMVEGNRIYATATCGQAGFAYITPVCEVSFDESGSKSIVAGSGGALADGDTTRLKLSSWEVPDYYLNIWPVPATPINGDAVQNESLSMRVIPRLTYAAPHGWPKVWAVSRSVTPLYVSLDKDISEGDLGAYRAQFITGYPLDEFGQPILEFPVVGTDDGWGDTLSYVVKREKQIDCSSSCSITLGPVVKLDNLDVTLFPGKVDNDMPGNYKDSWSFENPDWDVAPYDPWTETDEHDQFVGSQSAFFSRQVQHSIWVTTFVNGLELSWIDYDAPDDPPGSGFYPTVFARWTSKRTVPVNLQLNYCDLIEADNWGDSAAAMILYGEISNVRSGVEPDWTAYMLSNNDDRFIPNTVPYGHHYDVFDTKHYFIVKLGGAIVAQQQIYAAKQAGLKYNDGPGVGWVPFTGIGVIAQDLYCYFERIFDPDDPPRHTEPAEVPLPVLPHTTSRMIAYQPGLADPGTPIGWRMHVRNASGSIHWTVDSDASPEILPSFITSSEHHFYVLDFPLCDSRFGGTGQCSSWVFQHSGPEYAWPWMEVDDSGAAIAQRLIDTQMYSINWTDSVKNNTSLYGLAISKDHYPPRTANTFYENILPDALPGSGWLLGPDGEYVGGELRASSDVGGSPSVYIEYGYFVLYDTRTYRIQVTAKNTVDKKWLVVSFNPAISGATKAVWLDTTTGSPAFGTSDSAFTNKSIESAGDGYNTFEWYFEVDENIAYYFDVKVVDADSDNDMSGHSGDGVMLLAATLSSRCKNVGGDKFGWLGSRGRLVRQSLGVDVLANDLSQAYLRNEELFAAQRSIGELLNQKQVFNPLGSMLV